jgi:tetratricopeptide (TPR) repeat protein
VARRQGDADAAVDYYRRAVQAGPAAPSGVRRRLGEAKLKATEGHVQAARQALDQGQPELAASEYRAALRAAPEVSGVRLDLAGLLVTGGDVAGAMEVLNADPSGDRQVLLRLGAILSSIQQPLRAAEVYERLLARDTRDEEARRLAAEARRTAEFLQMPEEYRRIFDAPRVTRADLAALVAVKLTVLERFPEAEPAVATDISGSWARAEVLRVLARGVMDVLPNHTFQPASTVRRGELAQVVARILDLASRPKRPAPILADLSRANLYYDAVAQVVADGLMDLTPDGRFEPWRPVTGPEAVATIEALARNMAAQAVTPAR